MPHQSWLFLRGNCRQSSTALEAQLAAVTVCRLHAADCTDAAMILVHCKCSESPRQPLCSMSGCPATLTWHCNTRL